jgi:hypothetical protein
VSVIIGAIFVACVTIFRRGIAGEIQSRYARTAGSNAAGSSATGSSVE